MNAGPRATIHVEEHPREGRAVLHFGARPAPDGEPVGSIEYRLGGGAWRPGDSVEVRRRGIYSSVTCRAVGVAGTVGPEERWRKNWPGLSAAAFPEGSANWIGTYDWWKFRHHDRWWLDHPVCLVFRAPPVAARRGAGRPGPSGAVSRARDGAERDLVPRVEHILRRLGLRSHLFECVLLLGRASDGGLATAVGEPPDAARPTAFTGGLKRRLSERPLPLALLQAAGPTGSSGLQSSLHVRVYAPAGGCFSDPEYGLWVVGTCHLDVNELMAVRDGRLRWGVALPRGAPDPGVGADLIKYGGNSEWAAARVADLWERAFGRRSVRRAAAPLGEPQDWFQVQRSGASRGRSWVMGKWWRSDGCVTLLDLPES